MSLKQITCKHCGKVISPAPLIIGEPEAMRHGKTAQKMAKHLQARADEEAQQGIAGANGDTYQAGPHQSAIIRLQMSVAGFSNFVIAENFELSEDLEKAVSIGRRSIHEATRTVRMTDEEIEHLYRDITADSDALDRIHRLLIDLRDRYEGLGRYAPTAAAASEPTASAGSTPAAAPGTERKAESPRSE